uniref:Uncharacterized protein n=1 Tax=Moniliophthora roreri TaxID=221103 RepID=A0A0W0FUP6_MONRR
MSMKEIGSGLMVLFLIEPRELGLIWIQSSALKSDCIVIPSNVACGRCLNRGEGRSTLCTYINPEFISWQAVPTETQPWNDPGRQAEYIQVSFADFNALKLSTGTELEEDSDLLADVFPTSWCGIKLPASDLVNL